MTIVKVISSLILALPEILKLIKNIQDQIEAEQVNKKVKDDLKKINEAFKEKDASKLNDIFNNGSRSPADS